MKVCVSSRILYSEDWPEIKEALDASSVESFFPKKEDFSGKNKKESEALMQEITERYYCYIDQSDILYVNTNKGDVSRAVSCEIGYAKAKGLKIISSEEVEELEIRVMIDEVVPINLLKEYFSEVKNV